MPTQSYELRELLAPELEAELKKTRRFLSNINVNPMIHHRAQLGVYLRLLNIRIPGSFGPSADEQVG